MRTPLFARSMAGVAAAFLMTAPAHANGGDFFEELLASFGIDNANNGVPFFGFVRDAKGKLIPEATITATTGEGSSFVVQTNSMGRYRIPGFAKSVDAKKVQISCSKVGYKFVARDRRIPRGTTPLPIETNCILEPSPGKPAA